jgi:hypothetical protein
VNVVEISIHDNIVIGYEVSCEKREIILHTAFRDRGLDESTDILFCGVEAYYIVGDNMQSILFSIEECAIDKILKDFSSEFETGVKYSWPGIWNESVIACKEHFSREKCKGWLISSSFGMSGFIIAKGMEIKRL